MASGPLHVTIINDPLKKQDCDSSCGDDWSSLQVLDIARKRIAEKFGDAIHLTYMDLAGDASSKDIKSWIDSISEKNLPVPLLVVNGQIRISGKFDIRQMMDVIEVEMEMGV